MKAKNKNKDCGNRIKGLDKVAKEMNGEDRC